MKKNIMIIGSDTDFAGRLLRLFESRGYEVLLCCKDSQCIARVRNERPAMVLLEMSTPTERQGVGLAEFMSSDAVLNDIPVIAISGAVGPDETRPKKDELPVREVLSKSLDPESLIKRIAPYMAQSGGERHTMLTEDLQAIVDKWKDCKGNLIMILHAVQSKYGHVSRNVAFELSRMIDVPLAQIYEVITFYNFFKLEKPGTHKISLCMGTACYLKGAHNLLEELKRILHVQEGGTTADGMFTLETVRCIGCCGLSPVMMIGDKVYGKLKKEDLPGILSQFVKEDPAVQGA
jgi:NADH-quinone oxidoreductase subunit E